MHPLVHLYFSRYSFFNPSFVRLFIRPSTSIVSLILPSLYPLFFIRPLTSVASPSIPLPPPHPSVTFVPLLFLSSSFDLCCLSLHPSLFPLLIHPSHSSLYFSFHHPLTSVASLSIHLSSPSSSIRHIRPSTFPFIIL